MSKRQVVVTGIGAVAAPGTGTDDLWKGLQSEPDAPGPYTVRNWDPEPWIPLKEHRRLDRFTQFAMVATQEAFAQSGPLEIDPNRVTIALATGIGGLESLETLVHASDADDPRPSPFLIPMMMANAAAAAISIKYGFGGQVSHPGGRMRRRSAVDPRRSPPDPVGIRRCRHRGWHRGRRSQIGFRWVQGGTRPVALRDRPAFRRRPGRVRHGRRRRHPGARSEGGSRGPGSNHPR